MPSWAWGIVGVVVFLALGLAVLALIGLLNAPADAARRAWQRVTMRGSVYRGVELPTEVRAPEDRREQLRSPEGDERAGGPDRDGS